MAGAIVLGPRLGKYGPDGKPKAILGHNIPLAAQDESPKVEPVAQLKAKLTLPAGLRVRNVAIHDPDESGATTLKFIQVDRRLELEIPAVRIYKLVEITATWQE